MVHHGIGSKRVEVHVKVFRCSRDIEQSFAGADTSAGGADEDDDNDEESDGRAADDEGDS